MNLYKIYNELSGYIRVEVSSHYPEQALNAVMDTNIEIWNIKKLSAEKLSFDIHINREKTVKSILSQITGISFTMAKRGLVRLVPLYRKRYGMIAGLIAGFILIYVSTFFVWSIDITGNVSIPDAEIKERLAASGFAEGAVIDRLNIDMVRNGFLLQNPDISFMSINMSGTVANIEIHERDMPQSGKDTKQPYNLVADYGGTVVSMEIVNGESMVKVGDVVYKGQLLVGGVVDSNVVGYRIMRAEGKVFAKTYREFTAEIPFEYMEKRYSGREKVQKQYELLGYSIGFLFPSSYDTYDVMSSHERAQIFGIELPFITHKTVYAEYEEERIILDVDGAKRRAWDEYYKWRMSVLDGAEISEERVEFEETEESIIIKCCVDAVENIAVERKFMTTKR